MMAAVRDRYGGADRVEVREVPDPELTTAGVLVRVRAASLNRLDWYELTGEILIGRKQMGLRRPKSRMLGVDFAGTVEAVGADVSHVSVGDEVFGVAGGSLAEYVVAEKLVGKPERLSFEEAAAAPLAGITALQAVRDKAGVTAGQRVLVNGASGGVGTFTVQMAKAFGAAHVTAVCSGRHADALGSIGADDVVDYAHGDASAALQAGDAFDVAIQVNGSWPWAAYRRVLSPDGCLVLVGAPPRSRVIGPLGTILRTLAASRWGSRRASFFIAGASRDDLDVLRALLDRREITPVMDRTYRLDDAADAFEYFGQGHAGGKVVVTI